MCLALTSRISLRRNIPVTNGKELSLTADEICANNSNGFQEHGKKDGKMKRK